MEHSKEDSQNKRRGKAALPAGVIGASLSLAGAACFDSSPADASVGHSVSDNVRSVDLREVEVFDVTLGSFQVFDREDPQDLKPEVVAWWWGCRGCRGCRGCGCRGCRGCGCRGCRGCGG